MCDSHALGARDPYAAAERYIRDDITLDARPGATSVARHAEAPSLGWGGREDEQKAHPLDPHAKTSAAS